MVIKYLTLFLMGIGICWSCQNPSPSTAEKEEMPAQPDSASVWMYVLGTAQDAGSPQIGCRKSCCNQLWNNPGIQRTVTSLGLVDQRQQACWMFDASPDFTSQWDRLNKSAGVPSVKLPKGIFLTHAHVGHYTGLMYLGREAFGADRVEVFAMPRMGHFLKTHGPWSQLVELQNIVIQPMRADSVVDLGLDLEVTPLLVPHRDEYSETVGFYIQGPVRSMLFIPDIDKWEKWAEDLREWVKAVDWVLIDGTFYSGEELPGRDMSEIPHPSVLETMNFLQGLDNDSRNKVFFIHLNHTNPLWDSESEETWQVYDRGFQVARVGQRFPL